MIKFSESINDNNILKCIFFYGNIGAGKSTVNEMMFKGDIGVKLLDVDSIDELLFYKHILSLNSIETNIFNLMRIKKNIDSYSNNNKKYWSSEIRSNNRVYASSLIYKTKFNYINSMLPIVLMGNNFNINSVVKKKNALEKIGYDCYMVYVNCDIETSILRNKNRYRSEDISQIESDFNKIEKIAIDYNNIFKENFFEISNTKDTSLSNLKSKCNIVKAKILNNKVSNHIGKELLIYMKDNKLKYLSDVYTNLYQFYDKYF